jgi:putative transposase
VPSHPYRRDLPHIIPPGVPIFITWRLHGSLPARRMRSADDRKLTAGEKFRNIDRLHDRATSGPLWLRDPRIAACVCQEIERAAYDRAHYVLHEYVVMPNHVHMLVFPKIDYSEFMRQLKARTAASANRILRRDGESFWQSESFDHWCRSVEEMIKIRDYIVMNPVKAGLVKRPQQWPWSSAYKNLARKRGELRNFPGDVGIAG